MPVQPAVHGSAATLDRVLAGSDGAGPVAWFLDTVAPGEVLAALQRCLPAGAGTEGLRLVRAKLKPGRKLTAEYDVALTTEAGRRVWATWVPTGGTPPGPAPDSEADARRRGVLAPFSRSWARSHDGHLSVAVAPVDGAFPQLVRLHDPVHLAAVLPRAEDGRRGAVAPQEVTVRTVRYRPGQRHVLRIDVGAGRPALFVKVYRDDTGRRSVTAAARVAEALAPAGGRTATLPGVHLAAERAVCWPEVAGAPLAGEVARRGAAAGDLAGLAGAALRLLHGASARGLPACPEAVAEAGTTLRAAEVVDALAPALAARLHQLVHRALGALAELPGEPPTFVHGDFKCDNVVVGGSRLHLLDFDRAGLGDPAADVGKFLADLRWWTGGNGPATATLRERFLDGYGPLDGARAARARVHEALALLRMAARRVPVSDPAWEEEVARAVGAAAATLAAEARR